MRDIFSAYPELVDAMYKLLELRFPVYVMLVEDGNGQSEIAATFMLLEENEASITCMVGFFKKHNSRWESVRVLRYDRTRGVCYRLPTSKIAYLSLPYIEVIQKGN